jgi:hypothetical protein
MLKDEILKVTDSIMVARGDVSIRTDNLLFCFFHSEHFHLTIQLVIFTFFVISYSYCSLIAWDGNPKLEGVFGAEVDDP